MFVPTPDQRKAQRSHLRGGTWPCAIKVADDVVYVKEKEPWKKKRHRILGRFCPTKAYCPPQEFSHKMPRYRIIVKISFMSKSQYCYFWLTQYLLGIQCFWQCITKYLTKWNFFLTKWNFFSCPGQLNNWHCLSLGANKQSEPREHQRVTPDTSRH